MDCAGSPARFQPKVGDAKRQRAAAVQDLAEFSGSVRKHGYRFLYRALDFTQYFRDLPAMNIRKTFTPDDKIRPGNLLFGRHLRGDALADLLIGPTALQ